jgi:hypothetical protein
MKSLVTASTTAMAAVAVALAFPMTASAQPEWDIGEYDWCLNEGLGKGYNDEEKTNHIKKCCASSGGVWNATVGRCQAPPAEARPSLSHVGSLPVHTLQPSAPVTRIPSGVITPAVPSAGFEQGTTS